MKPSGPEVFLKLFQPARPAFERTQEECLSWLASAHAKAEGQFAQKGFERKIRKALERFGCGPERISKRGVELEDFLHTRWEEMRLFNLAERSGGAGTDARTRFFEEKVASVFRQLYPETSDPPNALIHVTCTGYVSPSGAQKLVAEREWNERTRVFHVYHMGCSAAMPAIGIGAGLLAYDRSIRRVDIVHTELCSLHFDPTAHTAEQFVIQSLFGDGSIRYALLPAAGPDSERGLRLLALREVVIPATLESMAWRVGDRGMRMVLSRDIPTALGASIEDFLSKLFAESQLDFQIERGRTVFAIHPGGPRILDQMERLLGLEKWQVSASQEVLYQHGNMSSATLPHVWARIVEDDSLPKGTQVASVAFGPGVTISGALFAKT